MATIDLQVGASADDGFWDNGGGGFSFNTTTADHIIGSAFGTNQWSSFFRIDSVTINQGETINSATLTVTAYATDSTTTCHVKVYCEDSDDAVAPTSHAEAVGLTLTTANTDVSSVEAYTANSTYDFDFTSALQEVVNRGSWASGNAIMVLIIGQIDSSARRQFYDYSGDSAKAAKINIIYSPVNQSTVTGINQISGINQITF